MAGPPVLPELPIVAVLAEVDRALAAGSAVLTAPPGSGKTTVVPLALLASPWLAGRKILILEPRRLAARAAAARMAALLGERVGQTVGYQIRFDRQVSAATRIEVVTEGILTRRLQRDPDLSGVGLIIFDEFHERSIHADLALALALDLCQVKDDLRLLVMSATLDTEPLSRLLGGVPVLFGHGQLHEVAIDYLDRRTAGRIADLTTAGIRRVVGERPGDVLAFLPGVGEIREVARQLAGSGDSADLLVLPLFGDLSAAEQDRAILPDPAGRRRVILATSIAETSLTIEGIVSVVDCGWSRRPLFDPGTGFTTLTTVRVSRAAADQRAGRAGRLGPGHCLRLWTRAENHNLPPFHPPEIVSADLAELALELALWGAGDPESLRWLDPPRPGPFRQARQLLLDLAAIDQAGRITETGRQLAELPIHPRLGHLLLEAKASGQAALACDLAALLGERDPLRRTEGVFSADLRLRLELLELWRRKGDEAVVREGGEPAVCRLVDRVAGRWRQLVGAGAGRSDPERLGSLLVHAYPDRIARRRPGQRERYLLVGGRGALIGSDDGLAAAEYLVIPRLDGGRREARILLAEPVAVDDLRRDHPRLFREEHQVFWDPAEQRVVAERRLLLGEIAVETESLAEVAPEQIIAALCAGIRQVGLDSLPWTRDARQFQARVMTLRTTRPEESWPDLGDGRLLADLSWLEPYLAGTSRLDQVARLDLNKILVAMLDWQQRQRLDRDAPETVVVPSGSNIRIDYRLDGPPVLAVRLQEMFGQQQTPTICSGRIKLLLHLLSPARRPIQVTDDLASFWRHGYPEVKKELKGRYPKHSWPDDPLRAEPLRGVPPRKKA